MWIVAVILLLLLLTALLFPLRLYFDFNGNLSRIFLGLKFFRFKKEIEKELNLFKKKNKDSSGEESFDSFQESVKPESVSSIKSKANVEKKEPIKSERDLSVRRFLNPGPPFMIFTCFIFTSSFLIAFRT